MEDAAASQPPMAIYNSARGPRFLFGVLHNLSIQIKAAAASAVLLICLLALGANAYVTSIKSAEGLRMLSHEIEQKLQTVSNVSDAIVTTHMKIFRYVSWASNSVSKKLLDSLRSEEHTSELQSHSDLHSFPTRRSSDLDGFQCQRRHRHDPYEDFSLCVVGEQ